jgi:hypothetical protein
MITVQEQVESFQKNPKITRKLLCQKHLTMPLYYAITNENTTNLPLTWASIKQGGVHANFFSFLEARKNRTAHIRKN